jgi:DNA-binding MarR family transcriptional regulator
MNRTEVDYVNQKTIQKSADVFESIHTIMHLFRVEQYRVLRDGPYELTQMEGKLLGFFAGNKGATLSDLVGHLRQDKGQLARLIKSLRGHGLLDGEDDAKDRRSVRLRLTTEGHAVHQTLRHQVELLSEVAVKDLSATERRQLVTLLHQVRVNLESASDTASNIPTRGRKKQKSPKKGGR